MRKNILNPDGQSKETNEECTQEEGTVIKGKAPLRENNEGDAMIGLVPGRQKVFVKTYGCSHNISDSEYMAGLLTEYGF